MFEVAWIKISTRTFDDEKIKLIEAMPEADKILIIWLKLLIQAGKKNENGYIFLTEGIPLTDEELVPILNRHIDTIRLALDVLTSKKFAMIKYDKNGIMQIANWNKYQNIEGLEKIKKQNRERQKKYRDSHPQSPAPEKPAKKPEELESKSQEKFKTTEYFELFFAKTQKSKNRIPPKVVPILKNTIMKAVMVLTRSQYEKVINRCVDSKGTDQSWEYYLDSVWREAGKIESAKHKKEPQTVGKILHKMANGEK